MAFVRVKVLKIRTELSHTNLDTRKKKQRNLISMCFYEIETVIIFMAAKKWTPLGLIISFNSGESPKYCVY